MRRPKEHERPEREHVPLHRSYGVTRRVSLRWEKFCNVLIRIAAIVVVSIPCLAACVCIWNFFLYFPELWIKVLLASGVVLIGTWVGTKTLRKRRSFLRKLSRLCRTYGFRMEKKRSFFSGFRWSPEVCDFVLHTPNARYEMRYFTVRKYNASLCFESKEEIRLVSHTLENRFTVIFDREDKIRRYRLQPPTDPSGESLRVVHGILVNPVSRRMLYKEKDGTRSATGNGAIVFGYTVYNASGFLKELKRTHMEQNEKL